MISSVSQSVEDNHKLALPQLSAKINRCLSNDPYDQTLGAMSRIVGDLNQKQIFISRGEFKKLYQQLFSRGTEFGNLFSEELNLPQEKSPIQTFVRNQEESFKPYQVEDTVLENALEHAFAPTNLTNNSYSSLLAEKAIKTVKNLLSSFQLSPSKVSVGGGNEKCFMVQADYETPKGLTSILLPLEVKENNQVSDIGIFMGNKGAEDLSHNNIKSYILNNTGKKLNIKATVLLNSLTNSSANNYISETELALSKFNAKKQGTADFHNDQILGHQVDDTPIPDVSIPQSNEFSSFEAQFTQPQGLADHQFGNQVVSTARQHLVSQLNLFGYRNPQIVVAKSDNNTIFYAVSLNAGKLAFTVPVKVSNKKIEKPCFLICQGAMFSFDKSGLSDLTQSNHSDFKTAAVASTMSSLKPSEIVQNIRQAMSENNFAKAEDALNVLAQANDQKAYEAAFQIYRNGLLNKTVENTTSCSHSIKSASSEHKVCTHTGLPINKIYQDKQGNCRPLYRQGMEDSSEGAGGFLNAKIFG